MELDKAALKKLVLSIETPLKARISELTCENKKLLVEKQLLDTHNKALHNSWQQAKGDYDKSQQDLRDYVDRVSQLKREIEVLHSHLNPRDVAA